MKNIFLLHLSSLHCDILFRYSLVILIEGKFFLELSYKIHCQIENQPTYWGIRSYSRFLRLNNPLTARYSITMQMTRPTPQNFIRPRTDNRRFGETRLSTASNFNMVCRKTDGDDVTRKARIVAVTSCSWPVEVESMSARTERFISH